jgi:hypothetical protein
MRRNPNGFQRKPLGLDVACALLRHEDCQLAAPSLEAVLSCSSRLTPHSPFLETTVAFLGLLSIVNFSDGGIRDGEESG